MFIFALGILIDFVDTLRFSQSSMNSPQGQLRSELSGHIEVHS